MDTTKSSIYFNIEVLNWACAVRCPSRASGREVMSARVLSRRCPGRICPCWPSPPRGIVSDGKLPVAMALGECLLVLGPILPIATLRQRPHSPIWITGRSTADPPAGSWVGRSVDRTGSRLAEVTRSEKNNVRNQQVRPLLELEILDFWAFILIFIF